MTAAPQALPDATALTPDQLRGWNCALCGCQLVADRPLGTVSRIYAGGNAVSYELWACSPTCPLPG